MHVRKYLSNSWILIPVILLITIVASSLPLFNKTMFFTHDFVHGVRIAEMTQALSDGHFPVRWSSNFGYGYGMPLFEFYAPLPFYIGSLFYSLGIPLIVSSKLLFLIPTVGTSIGAYLLGKKISGKWGGILTATLITLAPYRGVNLFIRGAISETWGIFAIIWILYSVLLVSSKKKYGSLLLVISLCTLFLSHNLTVIIAAPFIFVWVLFWIYNSSLSAELQEHKQVFYKKLLIQLKPFILCVLLAVGISSFYLLPLYAEKDFTKVDAATTGGYFNYQLHFLYIRQLFRVSWGYGGSEWGPNDKLPFFLGFGQYLSLLIASMGLVFKPSMFLLQNKKKEKIKDLFSKEWWMLLLSLFFVGAAIFMTLGKSQAIWDALPFMKYIQFPWRYYAVLIVFTGIAAAAAVTLIPKPFMSFVVGTVIVTTICINWQYFQPEKYLEQPELLYYDNPDRTKTHMSGILPDYIPKQLANTIAPAQELLSCGASQICPNVEIIKNKTQLKEVVTEFKTPQVLTFNIANYPGWTVLIDTISQKVETSKDGLVLVQVPSGKHTVIVQFGATPIRRIADSLSLISLSVGLYGLYFLWRKE